MKRLFLVSVLVAAGLVFFAWSAHALPPAHFSSLPSDFSALVKSDACSASIGHPPQKFYLYGKLLPSVSEGLAYAETGLSVRMKCTAEDDDQDSVSEYQELEGSCNMLQEKNRSRFRCVVSNGDVLGHLFDIPWTIEMEGEQDELCAFHRRELLVKDSSPGQAPDHINSPATNYVQACDGTIQDADEDWVPDVVDNCPSVKNYSQKNSDNDELGNACDNCDFVNNPNQADADHDGKGDVCEKAVPGLLEESGPEDNVAAEATEATAKKAGSITTPESNIYKVRIKTLTPQPKVDPVVGPRPGPGGPVSR